jgi:SAM-dependent methyltransferase
MKSSTLARFLDNIQADLAYAFDFLFDLKYGIDTSAWQDLAAPDIDSPNIDHGKRYQPALPFSLKKVLKKFRFPSNEVLLDFGCGKGRVLMVAIACGFTEVHGVEFSRSLCDIARENIAAFLLKTGASAVVKITHQDVVDYPIQPAESVFFLFNPFDEVILRSVLENVKASVLKHPRKIWIIYFNALHRENLESDPAFSILFESRYWGQECLLFSNRG